MALVACGVCAQDEAKDEQQERIARLVKELGHDEYKVREQATLELRKIGFPAMARLKAALDDDDPEVRHRAQSVLDSITLGVVEEAPADLVRIVREFNTMDTTAQSAAISQMAREMGENATPWLVARVRDGNRWYSPTALGWLTNGTNDAVRDFVRETIKKPENAFEARLKAWVDPVPKATPIPHVPGDMTLDAKPDDWKDIKPLPRPMAKGARGSLRMAWSTDGLHIFYEVGNERLNVQPDNPWFADSMELFLDLDFKRELVRTANSDAQLAFMPGDNPGPGQVRCIFGNVGRAAVGGKGPDAGGGGLRCVWAQTDGGYALEAIIDVAQLRPLELKAKAKFGMNYAITDDGRTFEQFACDKNENSGWESPILWGPVELQPAPEDDAPADAAE